MMNYDSLLSQLTDDKLNIFQNTTVASATVEEGAVEEEPVATIHTVVPLQRSASANVNTNNGAKSESATPQRKISTSSRFINAFQNLYSGATHSGSSAANDIEEHVPEPAAPAARVHAMNGMETKLLTMWHNVKYGWGAKLKSNFSKEQPVWLLGRCYHRKNTPPSSMESSAEFTTISSVVAMDNKTHSAVVTNACESIAQPDTNKEESVSNMKLYPSLSDLPNHVDEIVVPQELGMDAVENQVADSPWEEGIEGFRRDFYSRIWMTYRREFPTMNGTNYTSDCGWGCMLRSGQMLLAQGLISHFLGRSWRYDPETQLHSTYEDNMHKKIIKWFGDSSSRSSPFSIHALVSLGEQMGKKPGDWYGPASVSYLLKHAIKNASQENADFDNLSIYVAKDCTIYMQDVEELCCIPEPSPKTKVPWQTTRPIETPSKRESQHWKALIVLIPLRLGTEKLNPVYAHSLKLLLSTEYCIGIIGGRPKHSLYFVGYQEDKLIHLDPHYCQEMVDVNQENFSLNSFHCKSPRKLKTAKMDPSCCIGFYCPTKSDFDHFVESVQLYLHPMRCGGSGTFDKSSNPNATHDLTTTQQCAEINYPLFSFSRGRCLENEEDLNDSFYKPLRQQLAQMKHDLGSNGSILTNTSSLVINSACDDDDDETEEFVLL